MSWRWVRGVPAFTLVAAGLLALALAGLVAFDARYHEFWRDEVQPILIGQSVPLHRFLLAKRVDGHPPLFDLMTVPLVGVLSPLHRLLLSGAVGFGVLLYGTYRCILSICCRPVASLVLTVMLAGTSVYAYELGVVIRPYALGAGLALLTNAYLREGLRGHSLRPVVLGAAAGGLCLLTSTHAATLAGGAFVAFALVSFWRHRGVRHVLPTLAALPGLAVAAVVMMPFPGRVAEANVDLKLPRSAFVKMALQALSGGFTPQDWWVTASFGDPGVLDRIATLRHWGQHGVLLAVAFCIVVRLTGGWRGYRPLLVYDVLAILVGWAALLEIVVNHYWGSPRHHVFFGLPVVVVVAGWGASRGLGALPWASALALPLMAPWFAFQHWTCGRQLALDVELPFSDSKAAAALLPADAHLVADAMTYQEGYLLWRPGIVVRAGDQGGRRLGYVASDLAWHMGAPAPPMVHAECDEAPDRTYYSGPSYNLGALAGCLRLLRPASPHSEQTRPDERFDLWQVDCPCIARGR
jgi:hypothetical protein